LELHLLLCVLRRIVGHYAITRAYVGNRAGYLDLLRNHVAADEPFNLQLIERYAVSNFRALHPFW
jgi:hypothetical protein